MCLNITTRGRNQHVNKVLLHHKIQDARKWADDISGNFEYASESNVINYVSKISTSAFFLSHVGLLTGEPLLPRKPGAPSGPWNVRSKILIGVSSNHNWYYMCQRSDFHTRAPFNPSGPCSPSAPLRPFAPAGPLCPLPPIGPLGPCWPGLPGGPYEEETYFYFYFSLQCHITWRAIDPPFLKSQVKCIVLF